MTKSPQLSTIRPHPDESGTGISWDDVRNFLVLVETKSFRTAARVLKTSPRVVRQRLDALETQIGQAVFTRSQRGLELTSTGAALSRDALEMSNGAKRLMASIGRPKCAVRNVRVGCTEGLGAFWIMPRLLELVRQERSLNIHLNCETAAQDVANLAVDIAIQFEKPTDPNLLVSRLCWLHVVLFASRGYVERFGKPATKADLDRFNVLEIAGAQIWSHALKLDEHERDREEFVRISTNTASAQLIGVKRGAGITAIPTYSETITTGLVHVAEDWCLRRDVWLVVNPQVVDQLQVRKTINHIRRVFDPTTYPWFREEYIPPAEIRRIIEAKGLQSLFEGYSDYGDLSAV